MKKSIRGWIIALAGTLVMGTVYGGVINTNSVFVVPAANELGIPRQSFSLTLTLMFLFYMASSMFSGRLFKKLGLKKCMVASSILVPAMFFLNGYAPNLYALYASSAVIGFMLPFISFTAFSVVIKDWFQENSGLAIGISFMGSGIGGMVWSFLLGYWLDGMGYRASYRTMAMVMALVTIPTVLFLIKPNTENFGVEEGARMSLSDAMKDRQTLLVLLMSFLVGITPVIISQSMVPNAQDHGFSIQYASTLNAFFMGGLCLSKLVIGRMFDKSGLKATLLFTLVCGMAALAMEYFMGLKLLHPFFLVAMAINATVQSMAPSIIAMNYSKKENFPTANGLAVAFNYLGCALAPFLINSMYEAMGSYNLIIILDFAATFISIFVVLGAERYRKGRGNSLA